MVKYLPEAIAHQRAEVWLSERAGVVLISNDGKLHDSAALSSVRSCNDNDISSGDLVRLQHTMLADLSYMKSA
jgi:hypothetical protein